MKNEIKELYNITSKHSHYQTLYSGLERFIDTSNLNVKKMYENERLRFIKEKLEIKDKTVVDIGGNTGYFTFSLVEEGANKVIYYEGNNSHAKFVELSANLLEIQEKVEIKDTYFSFEDINFSSKVNIILLLNVLHHLGDDYGNDQMTTSEVLPSIAEQINNLSAHTEFLALQLGYNWKGNVEMPLFQDGTKLNQLNFIENFTKEHWNIQHIGIATERNESIEFLDLNDTNIERNDKLGEFLNRPIFILKSKKY